MLGTIKRASWFFGCVVFFLILFLPGFSKLQSLRNKNRDLENKIRRLNIENALLEEEIKKIASDPDYKERVAREKMGVVRKGEIPIKIIPQKKR
ncbi:MAG: septum formation initiator family protein [Candidatus Omnitrophota bacterium]|nr:septum formation initiator family protein [Candidatus Omnitrophota bacterium]